MEQLLFETISRLDHLDSDIVRGVVESNKTITEALYEIIDVNNKSGYVLVASKLTGPYVDIPRDGDIVVGFFSKEEVNFNVELASQTIQCIQLNKKSFTYALFDALPIVLICIRFHSAKVRIISGDHNNVYVIYALLDSNIRRLLALNKFYSKSKTIPNEVNVYPYKYIAYVCGMFKFTDTIPTDCIEWPHWSQDSSVEHIKCKAKERTSLMLHDFAKITWHPQRFMHWCLPFDEVPEDNTVVNKIYPTKLYLDNVILIDNVDVKLKEIDPFLKLQGLTRVGHFNRIVYEVGGGLPLHKDNPLQGGDVSCVFYLNDSDGGHITFPEINVRVLPKKGRCLIFDVNVMHYVEKIVSGTKEVLTCECVYI